VLPAILVLVLSLQAVIVLQIPALPAVILDVLSTISPALPAAATARVLVWAVTLAHHLPSIHAASVPLLIPAVLALQIPALPAVILDVLSTISPALLAAAIALALVWAVILVHHLPSIHAASAPLLFPTVLALLIPALPAVIPLITLVISPALPAAAIVPALVRAVILAHRSTHAA